MSSDQPAIPDAKGKSKLLTVCPFILGNELGERLAHYGLSTNLVKYFKELGASSAHSAAAVSAFSGFCCSSPLIGGYLADAKLGRYLTILLLSVVYLIGTVTLTGSAAIPGIRVEDGDDANGLQWALVIVSLFLVAVGTGGIKPNVLSFGADQFDETIEKEREEKKSFFNWFYFFINIGALIASLVIANIQESDMWDIGFGIPTIALFVAIVLFVMGRRLYVVFPPADSPLALFIRVTREALRNKKKGRRIGPEETLLTEGSQRKKEHWLDWATDTDGITEEDIYNVKLVYGVFPFFFTSIFYWLVFHQTFGLFILQGDQMERRVKAFNIDKRIASASMHTFDTATIIVGIPVYEFLLLPALKKYFNFVPTVLQRIGIGYALAVIAMIVAYILEKVRLNRYEDEDFYIFKDDDDKVEVVRLKIWWQIIPYFLIGVSEIFTSVGQNEFFYDQAPDSMRSMMCALSLLATGIGGFATALLILVVNAIAEAAGKKWITDNLNEGHTDYFFLLIGGIMAIVFVIFLYLAKNYEYKKIAHEGGSAPHQEPGNVHAHHEQLRFQESI